MRAVGLTPGVVRVLTDSRVVMGVVNAMSSRSPRLMADVRRLEALLRARGLLVEASWLASVESVWSDQLYRKRDSSEWSLKRTVFSAIERAWGPLTVDRFATPLNTHLPRFNSRSDCPGTEAVDTHAQSWAGERKLCNGPFAQVVPTIREIRGEDATAVVIVPVWRAQPWWHDAVSESHAAVLLPLGAARQTHPLRTRAAAPPRWRMAAFFQESCGRRRTGAVRAPSTTLASWTPLARPAPGRQPPGPSSVSV